MHFLKSRVSDPLRCLCGADQKPLIWEDRSSETNEVDLVINLLTILPPYSDMLLNGYVTKVFFGVKVNHL